MNKNAVLITHDIIYKLFSNFGQVNKILIFEKNKLWKFFVEMNTIEQAEQALINLNQYKFIEDDGTLNLFYSNMKELNLLNKNSGGVDYVKLRQRMQDMKQSLMKPASSDETSVMVNSVFNLSKTLYSNEGNHSSMTTSTPTF